MKIKYVIIAVSVLSLLSGPLLAKKEKNKSKSLPHGLQKKQARGKSLPPGWQKKLAKGGILDKEIVKAADVVIPLSKEGWLTIRLEGKLIRLHEKTREIIEILQ